MGFFCYIIILNFYFNIIWLFNYFTLYLSYGFAAKRILKDIYSIVPLMIGLEIHPCEI